MSTQNTWRPDTCNCKLVYEFDSSSNPSTRIHTFVSAIPCQEHASLGALGAYNACRAENRGKNMVMEKILTLLGSQHKNVEVSDGVEVVTFKAQPLWVFGRSRVLSITLSGLTALEKVAVRAGIASEASRLLSGSGSSSDPNHEIAVSAIFSSTAIL